MSRREELEVKAQRAAAESLRGQVERIKRGSSAPSSFRDFVNKRMAERRSKVNKESSLPSAQTERDR
jgi:hypothetical protein